MLQQLEQLAEQLSVKVSYESLAASIGLGGLCRVKGQYRVIIDKRATVHERVATLAQALQRFDSSHLTLPARVRETLAHYGPRRRPPAQAPTRQAS